MFGVRIVAMALAAAAGTVAAGKCAAQDPDRAVEAQTGLSGESPDCLPPACDQELEEVMVLGQRPVRNRDEIAIWLRRLAGRFTNEGTLETWRGQMLPVSGFSECVGIGEGPGLNCVIMLQAPNVDTNLNPGVFVLGIDLETPTVRYTSIDDTGAAVGTTGDLRGDTALFRTPCKSTAARVCVVTTRITARRGEESIRFQVDIQMDGRMTSRYDIDQLRMKQASGR